RAVRSLVSISAIEPPAESPTNRIPSGPKASGPADLSSSLPGVRLLSKLAVGFVVSASAIARAITAPTASTIRLNLMRSCMLPLSESRFLGDSLSQPGSGGAGGLFHGGLIISPEE